MCIIFYLQNLSAFVVLSVIAFLKVHHQSFFLLFLSFKNYVSSIKNNVIHMYVLVIGRPASNFATGKIFQWDSKCSQMVNRVRRRL